MTEVKTNALKVLGKTWIAIRFVLFGVGGFIALVFSSIALAAELVFGEPRILHPLLAIPMALGSALMMLCGTGLWGRWAYLWVFLSVPGGLVVLSPISSIIQDKSFGVLTFSLPMVVSYVLVRRYYRRKSVDVGSTRTSQDLESK